VKRALLAGFLAIGCVLAPASSRGAPGDWPLHGLDAQEQRHSPLTEIDRSNVKTLGPAWNYRVGSRRGLEATPLVVDGVMYATGTWSVVFALDAATGRELWRFDPKVPKAKGRHACCDVVNRGVAVQDGRVFVGALDGRLIALEAGTGRPIWSVETTDFAKAYTITGAPRVVKGKVIIGNGGADLGVRGYVSAYDAETGALAWRFYTVPASKDGPHEHDELIRAAATWPADSHWTGGLGATAWDSMAYDAELDLLYVGTGNSSIYDRQVRSPGGGDNLFVASILALRPDTGRLVWHYQTVPGEQWDYTATQHMILAELELDGRTRKVLLQAPKNGFFYVLDRATGELLSAEKYVHVSWASHVDLATGRPVERPEASWSGGSARVAPAVVGGHNWYPMSFHPGTGLVYIPATQTAYVYESDAGFEFVAGRFNSGEDIAAATRDIEGLEAAKNLICDGAQLLAWDPVRQKPAWKATLETAVPGGVLSTAGNLVFQGSGTGELVAYDAGTGQRLWASEIGIGIIAPPISYSVDGEQYVAVLAGTGGSLGNHFVDLDYVNDGRLVAFKLGGKAALLPVEPRPERVVALPALDVPEERVDQGRKLYGQNCFWCHGLAATGSGLMPDLRYVSTETHDRWNDIVLGGVRAGQGMASFADVLDADEAQAIRAYVLHRANEPTPVAGKLIEWAIDRGVCVPASWLTQ
jgi:quinohemoprotein ethanol dehydrogenase